MGQSKALDPLPALPKPLAWQALFDPSQAGSVEAPVYLRSQLQPGHKLEGPALITEAQTTTVVSSNYYASIDARANIVMEKVRPGEKTGE